MRNTRLSFYFIFILLLRARQSDGISSREYIEELPRYLDDGQATEFGVPRHKFPSR